MTMPSPTPTRRTGISPFQQWQMDHPDLAPTGTVTRTPSATGTPRPSATPTPQAGAAKPSYTSATGVLNDLRAGKLSRPDAIATLMDLRDDINDASHAENYIRSFERSNGINAGSLGGGTAAPTGGAPSGSVTGSLGPAPEQAGQSVDETRKTQAATRAAAATSTRTPYVTEAMKQAAQFASFQAWAREQGLVLRNIQRDSRTGAVVSLEAYDPRTERVQNIGWDFTAEIYEPRGGTFQYRREVPTTPEQRAIFHAGEQYDRAANGGRGAWVADDRPFSVVLGGPEGETLRPQTRAMFGGIPVLNLPGDLPDVDTVESQRQLIPTTGGVVPTRFTRGTFRLPNVIELAGYDAQGNRINYGSTFGGSIPAYSTAAALGYDVSPFADVALNQEARLLSLIEDAVASGRDRYDVAAGLRAEALAGLPMPEGRHHSIDDPASQLPGGATLHPSGRFVNAFGRPLGRFDAEGMSQGFIDLPMAPVQNFDLGTPSGGVPVRRPATIIDNETGQPIAELAADGDDERMFVTPEEKIAEDQWRLSNNGGFTPPATETAPATTTTLNTSGNTAEENALFAAQSADVAARKLDLDAILAALNDYSNIASYGRARGLRATQNQLRSLAGMNPLVEVEAPLEGEKANLPPGVAYALETEAQRLGRVASRNQQKRGLDIDALAIAAAASRSNPATRAQQSLDLGFARDLLDQQRAQAELEEAIRQAGATGAGRNIPGNWPGGFIHQGRGF